MSSSRARWLIPDFPPEEIAALSRATGISMPAAKVLWKRGVQTPQAVSRFLHPNIDDCHDPFLLADMAKAALRVRDAITRRDKILLYGDYDVDGTSSIVILHTVLKLAGADVAYHVPHRILEGYGMRGEVVDQARADNVNLIISVDTGIRASAVVERANAHGIDVIVTDHHLPEEALPPALAVINPNRPDCNYPEKNLCGAAVAWKLAHAIMKQLEWPEARRKTMLASLLKLVAIATVADVVPLTGENRIIVKHGLEGLKDPRNPGLKALFEVAGIRIGIPPSARQVGFQIAPRLNAAGRMDHASNVIELFLSNDEAKVQSIARKLDELNKERQQTEAEIRDTILAACEQVPVTDEQAGLVFSGAGWHQGVIGIVAGRLAERYSRPVFVLSEDPETGEAHGSGRGPAIFHLLDAMESMAGVFTRFGGHRQAAGCKLKIENIADFRMRFQSFAASKLTPEDLVPIIDCDAVVTLDELTDESAAEVLSLAPFGNSNPVPVFAIQRAKVARPPQVKNEKHLFMHIAQNGVAKMVKGWSMADRLDDAPLGGTIDVAAQLEEDLWSKDRGGAAWGLVLKDLR